MGIYRNRHKYNDAVILVPFIAALIFSLIICPILIVVLELPPLKSVLMVFVPIPLVSIVLYIRKLVIVKSFITEKDVGDKVEIESVSGTEFAAKGDETALMFEYSELMITVVYNWLRDFAKVGNNRLKMYRVYYDKPNLVYLGIAESDLNIPEEKRDKYVRETWNCIHFSDLWNGKVVNMKYAARVTGVGAEVVAKTEAVADSVAKTVAESDNGDENYEDNR